MRHKALVVPQCDKPLIDSLSSECLPSTKTDFANWSNMFHECTQVLKCDIIYIIRTKQSNILNCIHTHTLTHSLSLSLSETHTHTLSLLFSLLHKHTLSLSLTDTHTLSHSLSLSHTHCYILSLSHTHTQIHSKNPTINIKRNCNNNGR